MSKNDGGPAFPFFNSYVNERKGYSETVSNDGMSLRDYFAAAALQGIFASGRTGGMSYETQARDAYLAADAMLAGRSK